MPEVITVSAEGVEYAVAWIPLAVAQKKMHDLTNQARMGD
jgi:hypothetical protein